MGSRINKDHLNRPNRGRAAEYHRASTLLAQMRGRPQQQQQHQLQHQLQLPPSLSKYFNTTVKAKRLMDPDGRVCELDAKSERLELVFSMHPSYHAGEWTQMVWSQKVLWEASQEDPTMRISRKSPRQFGVKPGAKFGIFELDFYNPVSASYTEENLKVREYSSTNEEVTEAQFGYMQCKLQWIYLISEKQAPDLFDIDARKDSPREEGKGG